MPSGNPGIPSARRYGETLPVECWCRRQVVDVPIGLVRQCRTLSCGKRGCDEEVGPI